MSKKSAQNRYIHKTNKTKAFDVFKNSPESFTSAIVHRGNYGTPIAVKLLSGNMISLSRKSVGKTKCGIQPVELFYDEDHSLWAVDAGGRYAAFQGRLISSSKT